MNDLCQVLVPPTASLTLYFFLKSNSSVLLDSFQNQLQTPIIIVVHFMAEHYNTHCVRNLKRIKWQNNIIDCPCPASLWHRLKGKSLKTVGRSKDYINQYKQLTNCTSVIFHYASFTLQVESKLGYNDCNYFKETQAAQYHINKCFYSCSKCFIHD